MYILQLYRTTVTAPVAEDQLKTPPIIKCTYICFINKHILNHPPKSDKSLSLTIDKESFMRPLRNVIKPKMPVFVSYFVLK